MMENIVSGSENIESFLSSIHGTGLRVTKSMKRGDVVFHEVPWLFLQTIPNKQDVVVCANCACFVGSLGTQLGLLERSLSRQELLQDNLHFVGDIQLTPVIHCNNHCGEVYCSEQCRDNHFLRGHDLLCTGLITEEEAEEHPLIRFKMFAISTNEIFLMVADIFARSLMAMDRHSMDQKKPVLDYHLEPFESFIREMWWDIARNPSIDDLASSQLSGQALVQARQQMEKSDEDAEAVLRNVLYRMVNDAFALLNQLFELDERGVTDRLSGEYIARTIGMFEQNNVGVRLENPLLSYAKSLREDSPGLSHFVAAVERIVASLEGVEDVEMLEGESEDEHEFDEENINRPVVDMSDDGGEGVTCGSLSYEPAAQLTSLHSLIEEYSDDHSLFPPLDGTSFYTTICLMNHSCTPNVLVEYVSLPGDGRVGGLFESSVQEHRGSLRKGLCAQVRVLRDIAPGEEIFQSYIDVNLDYDDRQNSLRDYGIKCSCPRCRDESS